MPYRNEVQPLNLFSDYVAGRQAAIGQQAGQQQNALRGLQVQQAQNVNALAQNPNATPEQYARAGDPQTGMALQSMNQQGQVDKMQAVQQLASLAAKALTITDPAQRKGFLAQAQQVYAPAFQALGADLSQFPQMLQMPDADLEQKLRAVAQFAAPREPIKLDAGQSLVTQGPSGYQAAFTAPTAPKDNSITPYQQAQLDLDRQRLEQGKSGNAIQLQGVAGKLRDDYTGVVNKSGWPDQQNYYDRMKSIGQDGTGASDLALVFSFMKVLDPTSAVREGEYANAQNTAGLPGWVVAQYNKVKDGAILSPAQRSNFLQTGDKIYGTAFKKQEKIRNDFTEKASRAGVDPRDVLVDFGASSPSQAPAQPDVQEGMTATGPNGQKIVLRNGQWVPQ